MSDQPLATQKPKPGSLRDRIAAFEKSATASAAPINAPPPPRPKPAGFATWKPKHTSPPSSPPATQTEHAGPSSSMSASDARDSITKGASLKERMAALQNKGAFGAPPPVGPKPAVEKPKWKPPIVPSDEGDGPKEAMPVVEKTLSPPIRYERTLGDSMQSEGGPTHGVNAEGVNEDAEATQDPEDEERQRRAAIAARMARLGGARVGMAPPIIGKKPLRRPTQEEDQKTIEDAKPAEASPRSEPITCSEEQKSSSNATVLLEPETQKAVLSQSRKNSMNTTAEMDSSRSPKVPASMPVPVVPRRTGPPRKKPSKPSAPPPEPPKEESPASVVDFDITGSSQVVHEEPDSISGTSIGLTTEVASPIIEYDLSAPTRDLEASVLHYDHEELEKSEVAKSVAESCSFPQLTEPQLSAHGFEASREIEVDEVLPSAISPAQIISEPKGGEIEHEQVEDVVSDKQFITEHLGELASDSGYTPKAMHSEPFDSPQEEILNEDVNGQSEVDPKLDKPSDQNVPSQPPIAATLPSISSTGHTPESIDESTALDRRRSVPPPRRIVPAVPEGNPDREAVEELESDEEVGEDLAQSHLFIPPPKERKVLHLEHRNIRDEDDVGSDTDDSENDALALPVPHRHSTDMRTRSIIPSMHSDSSSEPDTDHDGEALPVPPRPVPLVLSPSRPQASSQSEDGEPRSMSLSISPPFPLDREVMDEDEGDPIDPDFHIPSRRSSYLDLARGTSSPSAHLPHSPPPIPGSRPQNTLRPQHYIPSSPGQTIQPQETTESDEDFAESRNQTIAERMARLGGIKFGTAPIPRPTSFAVQDSERLDTSNTAEDNSDLPRNDEEEERARKERIAAKLVSMGGMRIGMVPIGTGNAPVKGSQFQEESASSSLPHPVAPARPSRVAPRPPEQTLGAELDTGSPNTSDDGVKVEAEESEAEEVDYEDAELEEVPPIPSRSGRPARRESSGDTAVSPPPPARRPPIPATPPRRMSGQVPSPLSTPPLRKDSFHVPQYDYVMVDQTEGEEALPTRRASVISARPAPEISKPVESQENISSQWELPSIPTSSLNFGASADLSLSWSDAGELLSQPPQSSSMRGKVRRQVTTDMSISPDDLITIWGRVGVQVCEVATALFEKSKKTLIGDGTYSGFIKAVLVDVPNSARVSIDAGEYGYLIYSQNGSVVQKRASEIMPGDVVEVHDARFKGHKGLQTYQLSVGASGELVMGIVAEFDAKKSKIKAFQANQHVGQQTVESVSYRLDDLKSGTIKIYRVLEAV